MAPAVEKTWTDAFYMSVITLTTVGFGDVVPVTRAGRLFAMAWMLVGVRALGDFVEKAQQYLQDERKSLRTTDEKMSSHILEQLDTKQDGVLSRSEFLRYALIKFEHVKTSDLDSIDRLFDSLDRKKSGKLTKRQIVAGCD